MSIQTVHSLKGVGIAVIGKASQGVLSTGDTVEVLGGALLPMTRKGKVTIEQPIPTASVASLMLFDHRVQRGRRRDYLGVNINGSSVSAKTVKRGMCLVKQSAATQTQRGGATSSEGTAEKLRAYWRFMADIEFFAEEEPEGFIGKSTPMQCGFQPVFHFATNDTSGSIEGLPSEQNGVVMPGDTVKGVTVCLQQSNVMWKGARFIVREAGRTIGAGVVTEILDL